MMNINCRIVITSKRVGRVEKMVMEERAENEFKGEGKVLLLLCLQVDIHYRNLFYNLISET